VISAQIIGDVAARARLTAFGVAAKSGISRTIAKLGIDLKSRVQPSKLSGRVLPVRNGRITIRTNESRTTVSTTVHSDVRYAAGEKHGFKGILNVRASLRRNKAVFVHPIAATTIGVGGDGRRADLQEHSFLRSSLEDIGPSLSMAVKDALREALG
jgi:hypothetical protein